MGIFNPDTFMDTPVEGANSTVRINIDPGVYAAYIEKVAIKHGEKDGKVWAALNLNYVLEDEAQKQKTKRDKVVVFDSFFLDLTEAGTLDMAEGKNIPLGKLRKATGTNEGSFTVRSLEGQRLLVSIVNKPVKDSVDGDMRDEVAGVARLA
jgi:hypothetical protein